MFIENFTAILYSVICIYQNHTYFEGLESKYMVDSKGQQNFSCKYLDNKYFRVAGHLRFPLWLKSPIAVLKEATDNAWMNECGSVPIQFYLQKVNQTMGQPLM